MADAIASFAVLVVWHAEPHATCAVLLRKHHALVFGSAVGTGSHAEKWLGQPMRMQTTITIMQKIVMA